MALASQRRDFTVALVGFTSWAAVAWKLSLVELPVCTEALLALGAALLCLWPLALGLLPSPVYVRWRELMVPAHLALQHCISLRFVLPLGAQPLLVTPNWVRRLMPVTFLATFCQPWLHLAFGACLQRNRLRTFLSAQPLLLAPVFWVGREHCTNLLTATPEAARHLQLIAMAMQRCTSWLPVTPMLGPGQSPKGQTSDTLSSAEGACLCVHFWLVVLLAYCLPAIMIHRLEGQEECARQQARKQQQQQAAAQGKTCSIGDPVERDLLLQRRPTAVSSAAELILAGYSTWLLVQLAMPLLGYLGPQAAPTPCLFYDHSSP